MPLGGTPSGGEDEILTELWLPPPERGAVKHRSPLVVQRYGARTPRLERKALRSEEKRTLPLHAGVLN